MTVMWCDDEQTPAEEDEKPRVRPVSMRVDQRVRVATRSLFKTRIEMEKHCHDIIRQFRRSPVTMNVVMTLRCFHETLRHRRRIDRVSCDLPYVDGRRRTSTCGV